MKGRSRFQTPEQAKRERKRPDQILSDIRKNHNETVKRVKANNNKANNVDVVNR